MFPCTLGATRVPTSEAAAPPSCSTFTGAELPQAKTKSLAFMCTGSLRLCPTLCGLPAFSVVCVCGGVLQARILELICQN